MNRKLQQLTCESINNVCVYKRVCVCANSCSSRVFIVFVYQRFNQFWELDALLRTDFAENEAQLAALPASPQRQSKLLYDHMDLNFVSSHTAVCSRSAPSVRLAHFHLLSLLLSVRSNIVACSWRITSPSCLQFVPSLKTRTSSHSSECKCKERCYHSTRLRRRSMFAHSQSTFASPLQLSHHRSRMSPHHIHMHDGTDSIYRFNLAAGRARIFRIRALALHLRSILGVHAAEMKY